jgi:predicted RNA-binding Zn-ribbon protein involved in translation (DUF1610 family)
MAFLDKFSGIGETISAKSKTVVQKAKEATEAAGLNSQISAIDSRLRGLYEQLGRAYYEAHGGPATQDMAELVAQIAAAYDEQDALREQVKKLRGVKTCESCGAELAPGAAFCPNCGTKVPEPPVRRCPACAQEIPEEAVFCPNCGQSLNETPAEEPAAEEAPTEAPEE